MEAGVLRYLPPLIVLKTKKLASPIELATGPNRARCRRHRGSGRGQPPPRQIWARPASSPPDLGAAGLLLARSGRGPTEEATAVGKFVEIVTLKANQMLAFLRNTPTTSKENHVSSRIYSRWFFVDAKLDIVEV